MNKSEEKTCLSTLMPQLASTALHTYSEGNFAEADDLREALAGDEAQTISATGRPSDAYKLGQEAVDRNGDALRRLSDA